MESSQRSWCHMVSLGSKELKYGHYSCTMVGVLTLSCHIQKYWGHMHAIRQRFECMRTMIYHLVSTPNPTDISSTGSSICCSSTMPSLVSCGPCCVWWYRWPSVYCCSSDSTKWSWWKDSSLLTQVGWTIVMPLQSLLSFYFWSTCTHCTEISTCHTNRFSFTNSTKF